MRLGGKGKKKVRSLVKNTWLYYIGSYVSKKYTSYYKQIFEFCITAY